MGGGTGLALCRFCLAPAATFRHDENEVRKLPGERRFLTAIGRPPIAGNLHRWVWLCPPVGLPSIPRDHDGQLGCLVLQCLKTTAGTATNDDLDGGRPLGSLHRATGCSFAGHIRAYRRQGENSLMEPGTTQQIPSGPLAMRLMKSAAALTFGSRRNSGWVINHTSCSATGSET